MKKIKNIETHITNSEDLTYKSARSEYDIAGNITLEEEYSEEGEIETKIESIYDEKGNLCDQKQYTDNDLLTDHRVMTRDEDGNLLETNVFFADDSKSIITKSIDESQSFEETKEIDEDGQLETREVMHFNDDKQTILHEIYNFDNKLTEAFRFTYNDQGQVSRREQLDQRKKLLLYTDFTYDEEGRTTLRTNHNRKGKLSDFLKVDYDEKGQVVEQNFSGKFFFKFEYDTKGNTVLEERMNANNDVDFQSRFEYNEDNNLKQEINLEFTKVLSYEYFD